MSVDSTLAPSAIGDLIGAFKPLWVRRLQEEIDDRIANVTTVLNEYGFDGYGLSPLQLRQGALFGALLYRYYFRCETYGIENVPDGPFLLISNHAGQLPFDGMMLTTAMLLEATPPRIVRGMAEYYVSELPFVSVAAARGGSLTGTPRNCINLLKAGEVVMAFPEGARGMNKPFTQRYKLQRFGLGFMRLALEAGVPIVPVSIVGSEEQQPGITNLRKLGKALGAPAMPITLTFPWLGPLGLLPMPTKYHMYFHDPMHFEGDPNDEDAKIIDQVDQVRAVIEEGFQRGLRERNGVFS
ncbi:MAG: acyltransferase family protein [Actinomycetota bacterium]|nr:acyltransferase family protein [Actinomycetota bacterium]